MSRPPIVFQRTYVTLAAADLRRTYIRDTIVVDDTGAGVANVPLLLPKIGTAYAPVGFRTTIVKPSNATHAVAITPAPLDAVTSGAAGAFPDFGAAGAANTSALPANEPGSVTLEATDMNLVGSTQPNPSGGTPTTAGAWLAIDSGAGGGGSGGLLGKYWVNPAGLQPTAPYNTVQTGIDAAHADWLAEGSIGSKDVFVLPAPYAENVTLRAGVNVIGPQTTPLATPPTITGSVTTEDAAMTIAVHGLAILGGLTAAGTKTQNLVLEKCLITNAAGPGFLDNNSHASSTYKLIDSTISADAASFAIDMGSTGTLLAERCAIGNLLAGKALRTNAAVSIFRTCQFQGSRTVLATGTPVFIGCEFDSDVNTTAFTQTAGSTVTIEDCVESALLDPVYTGTGTLKREGANVYKAASLSASTITESGAGTTIVWQTTKFAGVGPHTQNSLARVYLFLPGGGGAIAAMNLLNTGNFPDHVPVTFINRDPSGSQVQLNADAGNTIDGAASLLFQTSITLLPDRATGTWFGTQNVTTPPTSPRLYVASTGSDAASQPGTLAAPLASVQEAARRLGASGWLVEAFIRLVDQVTGGANPSWFFPAPTGGALPITVETTYAVDFPNVACTGGTQGTNAGTIVGGTFTSANAAAANTQRGKILSCKAGAGGLSGTRYIIHSNDGAGGFTLPARLNAAPVAGNTFDILSRTGKFTWSGAFVVTGPAILDGVEFIGTGAGWQFIVAGIVQTSALLIRSTAAGTFGVRDCTWLNGVSPGVSPATAITTTTRQTYNPTGITICGDRWDGSGGLITYGGKTASFGQGSNALMGSVSAQAVDWILGGLVPLAFSVCGATFNDCGFGLFAFSQLVLAQFRSEVGRRTAGSVAVIDITRSTGHQIAGTFDSSAAADDLLTLGNSSAAFVSSFNGAAAAGRFAITLTGGSRVQNGGSNTATGGTVGLDIRVGGAAGMPIAVLNTFGVIEVGRTPWALAIDNSAVPATTANSDRIVGIFSLSQGNATFTWTTTCAQLGDSAGISLQERDATAVAPIVVVTANTVTVTFLGVVAAAGGCKFTVWIIKATIQS